MPIRNAASFLLAVVVVAALAQVALSRSSSQVLDIGSERQLLVGRYLIAESAGQAIHGFEELDCAEIFGDEVDRRVSWSSRDEVRSLEGKTIRLKFIMKDADLYSFGVQP